MSKIDTVMDRFRGRGRTFGLTLDAEQVLRAALELGSMMDGNGLGGNIAPGLRWLLDDNEPRGAEIGSAIAALVNGAMDLAKSEGIGPRDDR